MCVVSFRVALCNLRKVCRHVGDAENTEGSPGSLSTVEANAEAGINGRKHMLKYRDTDVSSRKGGGWDESFSGAVVLGQGCKQRSRFPRYHKLHQRTNGVKKSTQ